jgi:D-glycero-D-manno-heptose 1,7-bisphosphate phosphatase
VPNDKKIAFFDRDGVINKKADEHQYITKWQDFKFNPGIFDLFKHLNSRGFEFIILTNQRGIARKMLSQKNLEMIHDSMVNAFDENGIKILDIFYCPHDQNACLCRKPEIGLIEFATKKHIIDLSASILITDSKKELIMKERAGLKYSFLIPVDRPDMLLDEFKEYPDKYDL